MFQTLIADIPPITRVLCLTSVVLSYVTYIQIVQPSNLYLNFKLTFTGSFQPWRLFTSILYFGQFELGTFFRIFLLYRFSSKLEEQSIGGNVGHYIYFLSITSTTLILTSLILPQYSLSDSFVAIIMYVWSRKNQEFFIHILGIIPLKASYLTWFFMLMNIIVGESIRSDLVGILIGHTFYYLTEILPKLPHFKNTNPLKTPKLLYFQIQKRIIFFIRLDLCQPIQINRNVLAADDAFF